MKCVACQADTANPKFCSRSCAATFTNKNSPKRKKVIGSCMICGVDIDRRNKYCESCNPQQVDWSKITYGELTHKRSYQVNSRIRDLARNIYRKSDKPKKCFKCGYDKHYEVCHIKGISNHPKEALISDINRLDNLIGLCPNCHWELDNGLITIEVPCIGVEPITYPLEEDCSNSIELTGQLI